MLTEVRVHLDAGILSLRANREQVRGEAFAPTVCLTYLATFLLFFLTLPLKWWDKTVMEETRIAKELLGAPKN